MSLAPQSREALPPSRHLVRVTDMVSSIWSNALVDRYKLFVITFGDAAYYAAFQPSRRLRCVSESQG